MAVDRNMVISLVLGYDLLHRYELKRNFYANFLSNEAHTSNKVDRACWEVILVLARTYLTNTTAVVSDVCVMSILSESSTRRYLKRLESEGVIHRRIDQNDRRRQYVYLEPIFGEILDDYVDKCANDFKDLIHHYDMRHRDAALEELKKREDQLFQEKQWLNDIILGANVGAWEWNVQTGAVRFNERWAEIVGYTLEELAPIDINTWLKLAHPQDLERSNSLLEKHFNGELDCYEIEARMRHRNGSWIWILDRGKVVEWGEDGRPLRMSGTHTDINKYR